jgi:hypothetical protein
VATTAGFVCFYVLDVTGSGNELTIAKILSTLNILVLLRLLIAFMGFSLGFIFELKFML